MWLMRQAGRYMAAFREYSDKYPFRVRSETPDIAIELSLQARACGRRACGRAAPGLRPPRLRRRAAPRLRPRRATLAAAPGTLAAAPRRGGPL